MKVLIVANYNPSAGGISGQVTLLHRYLNQEDGVKADIYSTKGSILSRVKMFHELRKVCKEYDVIHVHCCSYIGFFPAILGVNVAKRLGKRVICTYHGGGAEKFFSRFLPLVRHYLTKTDTNIVLSGFLAKIFDDAQIPYVVIPNILAEDKVCVRQRTGVAPRFISVRTLEPIYNIMCILKAFKIVKAQIPDATLEILGDGSCRTELEKFVSGNHLKDVTFIGRIPNSEINKYLDKNDIFISMPLIDNQPMSVLEAWKNGLLVISSNVGGVPYLVENGKTGILVPSDNALKLAEAMSGAVNTPKESLEIMGNGQKSQMNYTWQNIRIKILNAYQY